MDFALKKIQALPREAWGAAWLALASQGAAVEAVGELATRTIRREGRSCGAVKFDGDMLDVAEGLHDRIAAPEEAEIEFWRIAELDEEQEALCSLLRQGTDEIAQRLHVGKRRAQQIVARMVADATRGEHLQDLFGEAK